MTNETKDKKNPLSPSSGSESLPQQFTAVNNSNNTTSSTSTSTSVTTASTTPRTSTASNSNQHLISSNGTSTQPLPASSSSTSSLPVAAPSTPLNSIFGGPLHSPALAASAPPQSSSASPPTNTATAAGSINHQPPQSLSQQIYSPGGGGGGGGGVGGTGTGAAGFATSNRHSYNNTVLLLDTNSVGVNIGEDRSPSDSPHTNGPPPTDETWQPTAGSLSSLESINGYRHKRKRSMSPTTQTQHHHLAAHEAAMGGNPNSGLNSQQQQQHRPGDDGASKNGENGGARSVRQRPNEGLSPGPSGSGPEPKKRVRVFSNRTKTGCITCRRRKKKCDEDKPECNNCRRGGFVCEGYSGKVSWQKPGTKQLVQSQSGITGPPFIQSKDEHQPETPTVGRSHPTSAITVTPTAHGRGSLEDRLFLSRSEDHQTRSSAPPGATDSISPSGYIATQSTPTIQHESIPASGASSSDRRVSFSHQALTAASGSLLRPKSEKEKMINSELYHANSPELVAERAACKASCWRYNNIAANPASGISEAEKGRMLLEILRPGNKWDVVNTGAAAPGTTAGLAFVSENGYTSDITDVTVDAPFICSYGYNIRLGKSVYIEFGCTILDSCAVTIKARTILSPGVSIYSATHPIDPRKRNGASGPEMAKPVLIEEDCWLGGNVIVLGGITIGKGSVVGAGSVVTRDVPPFTVVAGNPARVVRGIYQNGVDM